MLSIKFSKFNKNKNYSAWQELDTSHTDVPLSIPLSQSNYDQFNKISTHALMVGNIIEYSYNSGWHHEYIKLITKNNKVFNDIHVFEGSNITLNKNNVFNGTILKQDATIYEKLNKYTPDELLDYLRIIMPFISIHKMPRIDIIMRSIEHDIMVNNIKGLRKSIQSMETTINYRS